MNMTIRTGLLLVISAVGASACTSLLGGFDFEGQTTSTGGTMTTGAGGTMCVDPLKDCAPPASECVTAICDGANRCGTSNVAADTATPTQIAGDCKKVVCDGNGATKANDDDTDIDDDAKECTTDTCAAGAPVHIPLAAKTPCGMVGGTLKCDAAGTCGGCVNATDCGAPPTCKINLCTGGVCGTENATDASACSDGNSCTQTDSCQAGVCTGYNPVVCVALDQCHNAGACQPNTGMCSASLPKGDTAACNDGNACTFTDSCQAAVCVGSDPISCPIPDQCHDVGACVPATGTCPITPKANGVTCNDGSICTQTDTCQAGACTGSNKVVCTAQDECHEIGVCSLATGICSNPNAVDGTPCAGGTKMCMAGFCQ